MENTTDTPTRKAHMGRNVKFFREMKNWKQEALATEMGHDWTQRKISALEQMDTIDKETIEQVAKALNIGKEYLENFNDERAQNIFGNTFHDSPFIGRTGNNGYDHCTFNPLDKIVELYERLLESEKKNKG